MVSCHRVLIQVWTNNMYKSTLHRVIHKAGHYRTSIPFFFEPNFDAMISPLPHCVAQTGGKALHSPVMYGDHLLSKVSNNFDLK
jgi:isopenicillin N synthase-like dioxygenase